MCNAQNCTIIIILIKDKRANKTGHYPRTIGSNNLPQLKAFCTNLLLTSPISFIKKTKEKEKEKENQPDLLLMGFNLLLDLYTSNLLCGFFTPISS